MKNSKKIIISMFFVASLNLMAENTYNSEDTEIKNDITYVKNTNEKVTGIIKKYYPSGALESEWNYKDGKAIKGTYYKENGSIDRKMTNADFHNLGYEY